MAKLTEKDLKKKIAFHEKKVSYYQEKLDELTKPVIGFAYKNRR